MDRRLARRVILISGLLLLTILIGTVGFQVVEGYPAFDAFYMTLMTITTVGYGDATPTDPVGRAVGAVIMLVSIATLSILTAFITSAFVEARQAERRAASAVDDATQQAHLEAMLSDIAERLERLEQQGRRPT